jgi:DNA-binding MarR family transcriptional regulator
MTVPASIPPRLLQQPVYLLSVIGQHGKRRYERLLAAQGLGLRHIAVLSCLVDFGSETATSVGKRFDIDASDMTTLVDQLVDKGLVRREADSSDRRKRLLVMTAAGHRALDAAEADSAAISGMLLDSLGAEERASLLAALADVLAAVDPRARS